MPILSILWVAIKAAENVPQRHSQSRVSLRACWGNGASWRAWDGWCDENGLSSLIHSLFLQKSALGFDLDHSLLKLIADS
jgi:hypothetical protein